MEPQQGSQTIPLVTLKQDCASTDVSVEVSAWGLWTSTLTSPWMWVALREGAVPV